MRGMIERKGTFEGMCKDILAANGQMQSEIDQQVGLLHVQRER